MIIAGDFQKYTETMQVNIMSNVMRIVHIGGLKEKLLAALRGGIQTVLIPAENEKDLEEIPDNVKQGLHLIPVTSAEQVLELALTKPLKTNSNKGES